MLADGVFEGGGMRGIGIIGALSYFETIGIEWKRAAGTSVGAVIAACVIAGYSPNELAKIIMNTDFIKFMDKDWIQRIPVFGKAFGIYKNKAIYSGEYTERWIGDILSKKGVYKFKDISVNGESRLKVIASDITNKLTIILPDDLVRYDIDPMEFEVAKAVRMSCSIPFYFKPVKIEYNGRVNYIVDGGICWNFPITIFDVDGIPKWPTIGFKFDYPKSSIVSEGRMSPVTFMYDIANTMSERQKSEYLLEKNLCRTVLIPTADVKTTQFDLTKEKGQELYKAGYRAAREFLKIWDFEEYIKKYRR